MGVTGMGDYHWLSNGLADQFLGMMYRTGENMPRRVPKLGEDCVPGSNHIDQNAIQAPSEVSAGHVVMMMCR